MLDPCSLFKSQFAKAQETLHALLSYKLSIEQQLESNVLSSELNKKLREVNMEIKITKNELEHAELSIKKCESSTAIKQQI